MATYFPRARVLLSVLLEELDGGEGEQTHTFEVHPSSVEVVNDHYRSADQVKLEVDYRDFPLDPRSFRSILVTVHMGDAGGASQQLPLTRDTLRFVGFIDEPETELSADGERVRMDGRDYTALLLDYRWPGTAIEINRRLDDVVIDLVHAVPGAEGIEIEFAQSSDGVNLSELMGRTLYAPHDGDDAWTVLVDLCGRAGLLPVFRQDVLYIENARQFQARSTRFVYGKNIARLAFRRRFNEVRSSQISIRCWDESAREVREARYPASPVIKRKRISTQGKVSVDTEPLATFQVSGAYSQSDLEDIAQSIYEERARDQFQGELETKELVDLDGEDLAALANGDTLSVRLGREDLASISSMSTSEAVTWLSDGPAGMRREVAEALVDSWRRAEAQSSSFYVKRATHHWDREQGYKLSVQFINYVGAGAS